MTIKRVIRFLGLTLLVAAFLAMPAVGGIALTGQAHASASHHADVENQAAATHIHCCKHHLKAGKSIQECCIATIGAEAARSWVGIDRRAQSRLHPETRDGIDHLPLRRPPRGTA